MSRPPKIGFRVPYGCNDATRIAVALADVASEAGAEVVFASTLIDVYRPVHENWDDHVICAPRLLNSRAFESYTDFVWFSPGFQEVSAAKRSGCRCTYVAMWPRAVTDAAPVHKLCHTVLTSQSVYSKLQAEHSLPDNFDLLPPVCSVCNFSVLPATRDKSLWVLDSVALRRYGSAIFHTASLLLSHYPDLRITVLVDSSWDSGVGKIVNQLQSHSSPRFIIGKRFSQSRRCFAYKSHGWLFNLACRDSAGMYLLECVQSGRPTVTLGNSAAYEILDDTDHVVDCDMTLNELGGTDSVVCSAALLEAAQALYATLPPSPALHVDEELSEKLETRRKNFKRGWKELWELD